MTKKKSRLTSIVVGCKNCVIGALVGQLCEELTTRVGRVDSTDCGGESGEARVVQGVEETRNISGVLVILSVYPSGGEGEEESREDENHCSGLQVVGRGEEEGLRRT